MRSSGNRCSSRDKRSLASMRREFGSSRSTQQISKRPQCLRSLARRNGEPQLDYRHQCAHDDRQVLGTLNLLELSDDSCKLFSSIC